MKRVIVGLATTVLVSGGLGLAGLGLGAGTAQAVCSPGAAVGERYVLRPKSLVPRAIPVCLGQGGPNHGMSIGT